MKLIATRELVESLPPNRGLAYTHRQKRVRVCNIHMSKLSPHNVLNGSNDSPIYGSNGSCRFSQHKYFFVKLWSKLLLTLLNYLATKLKLAPDKPV